MDQLKKHGEPRDAGVLTDEEFKAKKTDLLSRL
jgi:Short C-terminal domain